MEELLYVLTKDFVSCVHVRFYFFTAAHFHLADRSLLAASISHLLTAATKFSRFSNSNDSSPLFSITGSSSFSSIQVSLNIKKKRQKDTTLLLFFLSKSPSDHAISFQIKPWVAFGLLYVLIELFILSLVCLWCGRTGDVRSRVYQNFSDA